MKKLSGIALTLLLCMSLAALPLISATVSGQYSLGDDSSGPIITDLSDGTPVTGQNFNITALVTDSSGVSYVRLYLYYKLFAGITQSQLISMDKYGSYYQSIVSVPNDATAMYYSISANDTLNNWRITDVISRNVEDDQDPVASCSPEFSVDMGGTVIFNGSGSQDNVGIANYTWSLQYGTTQVLLYGQVSSFEFRNAGQYQGTLSVSDPWGNRASIGFLVKARDTQPPRADAGITLFVQSGSLLIFNGSSSSDNVAIVNYTWELEYNGTAVKLYGDSPPIVFWTPGKYDVRLTVRDAAGNTDSAMTSVHVLDTDSQGSVAWWVYALIAIVFVVAVLAIIVIRI